MGRVHKRGSGVVGSRHMLLLCPTLCRAEEVLAMALARVGETPEQVTLLRLRPGAEWAHCWAEEETLYAELKGAQARLSGWALPVKLDTAVIPTTRALAQYVRQHQIDLILVPDYARLGSATTAEELVQKIGKYTRCQTQVLPGISA